jgi:periplasmic divalent cation tolerance protein
MTDKIVVFSTCGSLDEAERIADHLITTRLAACVSISPAIRSFYRWEGEVNDDTEWGLTIKTRMALFETLCRELREIHTYATPEILAVPVLTGSEEYLQWIDRETSPPGTEAAETPPEENQQ